jgi:hypothetical protein
MMIGHGSRYSVQCISQLFDMWTYILRYEASQWQDVATPYDDFDGTEDQKLWQILWPPCVNESESG